MASTTDRRVLLGVSGGVDSCAAALLLRSSGYEPLGVRLILKEKEDRLDEARLKGLDSLGIPVVEVDGRDVFRSSVVEPFLEAYERSTTPNPCVICNERVKFRLLFEEADRRGIHLVGTGHYAGITPYRDGSAISRAEIGGKDQSYMLYRLPSEWLGRLIFPLENLSKPEVRDLVFREFDDEELRSGDSQDICFIPGSLESFLDENLSEEAGPGPMISLDGDVLGRHRGLCRYTEGQRKGLGLGGGPWFVVRKDRSENALILGREADTSVVRIGFSMLKWQHKVNEGSVYMIQHRYRSAPVPAVLSRLSQDSAEVLLEKPARGVAPGQSLVLYDGPCLLGGGVIDRVYSR